MSTGFTSTSAEVDPYYPAVYGIITNTAAAKQSVDTCMGFPDANGVYHYHMIPACIGTSTISATVTACSASTTCNTDVNAYASSTWNTKKTLTPLGIAKDGHVIYGPYKNSGSMWSACDVDICNGITLNGVYSYVATHFHPYFIGCWGPGN